MVPINRILASLSLILSLFLISGILRNLLFPNLTFPKAQAQDDDSDVVITHISNSPSDGQGDQYSSVAGGATFYVKGTGFNQYASNNYVYLGPYQATVLGRFLNFALF